MKSMRFIVFFALLFILSCGQKPVESDTTATPQKEEYIGTGKFIPINFNDTNYVGVRLYAKDTVTPNGWHIQYLVKDDSTRYSDLYIQWEKEGLKGLYKEENVLLFRRYFIPEYIGETPRQLLFWHGCATDCQAVLVCDKDKEAKVRDIPYVINYNLPLGQIVYLSEESFDEQKVVIEVLDLLRGKGYSVVFNGVSNAAVLSSAIDTVIFSKSTVSITASLRKTFADTIDSKITKVVELK